MRIELIEADRVSFYGDSYRKYMSIQPTQTDTIANMITKLILCVISPKVVLQVWNVINGASVTLATYVGIYNGVEL